MGRVLTAVAPLCAVSLTLLGGAECGAQEPTVPACSYEECALRVKRGLFGSSLVRGSDEERVTGLGFWIGSLDSALEGSPVAQDLANTFRTRHNTGTVIAVLGAAVLFATLLSEDAWLHSDPPATFWIGMAVATTGGIVSQSSWDRLSRAAWEFNRILGR